MFIYFLLLFMMVYLYADSFFSKHDYHDMLNICAAKIQIFSQTNVKMLRYSTLSISSSFVLKGRSALSRLMTRSGCSPNTFLKVRSAFGSRQRFAIFPLLCLLYFCKGNANREQNLPSLLEQLCRDAAYLLQR